jgi:hypothetical protein
MAKPVGCGESANRIERVRLNNDAVPFGHHILQTQVLYFRKRHEGHEVKDIFPNLRAFVVKHSDAID